MTWSDKEVLKKYRHDYYLKNKEQITLKHKLWRDNNKESYSKKMKEWYLENRQKRLTQEKIRYENNREKMLLQKKEYYLKNRTTINAKRNYKYNSEDAKKYRKAHPEYCVLRRRRTHKMRMAIIDFFGGQCKECGNFDFRVLQLDHINGGGSKDYKKTGSGYYLSAKYKMIKENPLEARKIFQLLCANCNWIKRWEKKEYGRYNHSVPNIEDILNSEKIGGD